MAGLKENSSASLSFHFVMGTSQMEEERRQLRTDDEWHMGYKVAALGVWAIGLRNTTRAWQHDPI